MTLWAYPMDRTGCGMYRIVWPLEALAEHRGLDWHCAYPEDDEGIAARLDTRNQITHVRVPEGCTGLLVQRPTSELLVETLTLLKRSSDIPLLVDVDDDLSALSPKHPAFHHLHPRSRGRIPGHSARAVHQACDLADLVLCSTPALLERYAKHGRGVVLENRLPRALVSATPPHPRASSEAGPARGREAPSHTAPRVGPHPSMPIVGWPGSLITHPDDLSPALTALHRLQVDPFVTLGPDPRVGPPHNPGFRLPYPHMTFSGRVEFSDWLLTIQRSMNVGIAPLEPSRFNAAKSWLKPLELSAAQVPFVCSDTAEYRLLGAGLQANKPKDWHRLLRDLLNDPDLRAAERARNRAIAEACTYDHPDVLADWAEVFRPWVGPPSGLPRSGKPPAPALAAPLA